jgi:hypothetical protein
MIGHCGGVFQSGEFRHAGRATAPFEKLPNRAAIGAARVRVADGGGEEFHKTNCGLVAGGGDERRQPWRRNRENLNIRDQVSPPYAPQFSS